MGTVRFEDAAVMAIRGCLSVDKVGPVLKCLDFYGITVFRSQLENQLREFANADTVSRLIRSCVSGEIPGACLGLLDPIVASVGEIIGDAHQCKAI